ncbi:uncharacterized protein [Heterodontus francisci]|uniref:uncharacterized protein n=1 Tax=Heterodontus francisci TaxID=7792 RepID=UPI00355C30C7
MNNFKRKLDVHRREIDLQGLGRLSQGVGLTVESQQGNDGQNDGLILCRTLLYNLKRARGTEWDPSVPVYQARGTEWDLPVPVYQARGTEWDLSVPVYQARGTEWDLPVPVYQARGTEWDLPVPVYQARVTEWDLPVPVYQARGTEWDLPVPVYQARGTEWDLPVPVYQARGTEWDLPVPVYQARGTEWDPPVPVGEGERRRASKFATNHQSSPHSQGKQPTASNRQIDREAISFLVRNDFRSRKQRAADLAQEVLQCLQGEKLRTAISLSRELGRTKTNIQHCLYDLQKQNKVEKVGEKSWKAIQESSINEISKVDSTLVPYGKELPPPANSNLPAVIDSALVPYGKELPPPANSNLPAVSAEERTVLGTLKVRGTLSALDLAKCLGLASRKSVNPMLYALEKRGLVRKEGSVWLCITDRVEAAETAADGRTDTGSGGAGIYNTRMRGQGGTPGLSIHVTNHYISYQGDQLTNIHQHAPSNNTFSSTVTGNTYTQVGSSNTMVNRDCCREQREQTAQGTASTEDRGRGASESGRTEDRGRGASESGRTEDRRRGASESGRTEDRGRGVSESGRTEDRGRGASESGRTEDRGRGASESGRTEDRGRGASESGRTEDRGRGASESGSTEDRGREASESGRTEDRGRGASKTANKFNIEICSDQLSYLQIGDNNKMRISSNPVSEDPSSGDPSSEDSSSEDLEKQ